MIRIGTFRMLIAGLCIFPSATFLQADVVAETVQNLRLSLTSSAGSVVFIGSNGAAAFGMVSDSFGATGQQMNGGSGAVSVNIGTPAVFVNGVSVGGATATASANASALTGDNLAAAELFSVAGTAAAKAVSTLTGSFEIVGTSSPTNLNVSASLQIVDNFVETDAFGLSGSSEALFSFTLGNGDIPVAFDNLVSVGPSRQQEFTLDRTLTGSSLLQPGTPYTFTAVLQSDAVAANAVVPEPSYGFPSIILLFGLFAARQGWHQRIIGIQISSPPKPVRPSNFSS